jgi:hypothetical protein
MWLVNWEPRWEAAKMIRSNLKYIKWLMSTRQALCPPLTREIDTDKNSDNLARQGLEDPNRHTHQWKSTLGKHISILETEFILKCNLLTCKAMLRAQATANYGTDRSILSDHLQYKKQHMTVSNTTHLANCHKQRTG